MKIKILFSLVFIFLFTLLFSNSNSISFSTGWGFPELSNIGIRLDSPNATIGFSAGKMGETTSLSFNITHFLKVLPQSNIKKKWYFLIGFNHFMTESNYASTREILFNPRFGRRFMIYKILGVELDIGIAYQIFRDKIYHNSQSNDHLDFNFKFLPSIGFRIFVKT